MVLVDSDLEIRKSAFSSGGISSLGGEITTTVVNENLRSLWDSISSAELSSSVVGEYEVRCVYIYNASLNNETLELVQVYVLQNTASPYTDIDIGVGISAAGDIEQTVANENTLPANIAWTFARGEENAQLLGTIAPGEGKSLWIRRHAGPARADSSYPGDNYVLGFKVKSTGPVPPPPGGGGNSGNDKFGIRMIYPTNTFEDASTPFYINMSDPLNDCRLSSNIAITKNADGSLAMGPSARIRMYADYAGCAKDIFTEPADTYDHDTWGERGHMVANNDWKNVEITGHFKCVGLSTESERKLYLYSRTWRHNTTVGGGCGGSAYKGVLYGATGQLKFHKESFHNGDQPCGDRNIYLVPNVSIPRTDNNKWYGFKVMMWNYIPASNPNAKHVHMEIWLDLEANNTWTKYAERNDEGGWYPGAPDPNCPGDDYCGGNQDQIIHWGGPVTEVRWDGGYSNVHFRYLSVREIIAPLTALPPPPAPPPPPPGGGPPPPPPPPPPSGSTDIFGVKKIYETKSGGWESYIDLNSSFDIEGTEPAGSLTEIGDSSEWFITHDDGLEWATCTGDGILKYKGKSTRFYTFDPADVKRWKNVEYTWFANLIKSEQYPNYGVSVRWYSSRVRSNDHLKAEFEDGKCQCNERNIAVNFHLGRDEVEHSLQHGHSLGTIYSGPASDRERKDYYTSRFDQSTLPTNKTIGFKHILKTLSTGVNRQEVWCNPSGDGLNWELVSALNDGPTHSKWEVEDIHRDEYDNKNAEWDADNCRDKDVWQAGVYDKMLLKEGGCSLLRTNNIIECHLSKMSCREIVPE